MVKLKQKQRVLYLESLLRRRQIAMLHYDNVVSARIEAEIQAKCKKWKLPYPKTESISISEPIQSYENECVLHLPGRSRPTLSQYDNRRSGTIVDRYYFGIYPRDS